ncbi:hypothetical protein, variant [Aphanomyces astaci]|uniref:Uncharacterized protein n=1 Tax=Aphanomyces astaci TaxID=112090 RepID=W4FXD1_APHAT|nr:hypothetical protein H257_13450 [Aphanomyces astaci]XP_009839263.1 hypothetical protein, variant [Aphanomyces astaci]ETV71322.1 hypothetical protein H257_13450 [Aphanomyces astaci]ETV71323.1 hypothetical protein, variant [Aphanomyces astaci]|eukprot:XP_009839262.1 hypothetical protein H257_13450 [Aphanomyces astaci]
MGKQSSSVGDGGGAVSSSAIGKRTWREDVGVFVRFCRLRYLAYSVLVHLMGAMAALADDKVDVTEFNAVAFVKVQLILWWVHVVTHWSNDYYDLGADSLNTKRGTYNGGSGVLVDGLITPAFAYYGAWIGTIVTAGYVALLNAIDTESPFRGQMAMLVAAAVGISWQYTAPPLRLQYRGFGELCIALVFAVLIPLVGAASQIGTGLLYVPVPLRPVMPLLALQQFARMIIMNAPDIDSDLVAGKLTFTARVGLRRASILYTLVQVIMTGLPPILVAYGRMSVPVAIAFAVVAPQGWVIANDLHRNNIAKLPFMGTLHVASQAASLLVAISCLAYQRSTPHHHGQD